MRLRINLIRFLVPLAGLALVACLVFQWITHGRSLPATQSEQATSNIQAISDRPVEQSVETNFVASRTCQACHPHQYETWHDSYHRRMTQVASPEAVIGDFQDQRVQAYGREFVLTRKDDEFWVNMDDPTKELDASRPRLDRRIVMTTGSHHMQVCWYATGEGRTLGQLPLVWLRETQQWVPSSAVFISPPPQPLKAEIGRWNEVCIKCHTTGGRPRQDGDESGVFDSQVAEFGIACEACHGPGASHVAAHRGGLMDATGRDVVHPESLPHSRSAQICGQCHAAWIPKHPQGYEDYLRDGVPYRAGDELTEVAHLFHTGQPRTPAIEAFLQQRPHYLEDRFWDDGMSRVSGSEFNAMVRSACFTRGEMTCTSCHQMHQSEGDPRPRLDWANDQLRNNVNDNVACLQCHDDFSQQESLMAHTHHPYESSGSVCYNCHMPHTTYGLLKAIRSHQVHSPRAADSAHLGRPNACNQCHLDQTLAWTSTHLQKWYGLDPITLTDDQEKLSATVLWCLTGDAGQRALAAWTLGWQPAQEASGTDWMVPILAQLLADPYDAVRYVTYRSLRTLPGFEEFEFDYVAPPNERNAAALRAFRQWHAQTQATPPRANPQALISTERKLMLDEFQRLNQLRDNREVLLME